MTACVNISIQPIRWWTNLAISCVGWLVWFVGRSILFKMRAKTGGRLSLYYTLYTHAHTHTQTRDAVTVLGALCLFYISFNGCVKVARGFRR